MPPARAPRLAAFAGLAVLLLAACQTKAPRPPLPPPAEDPERLLAEGEYRRAAELLEAQARQDRRAGKRLWLRAAEAWREEGDLVALRAALDALSAARGEPLPEGEQRRLELLLAETALADGDPAQVLALLAPPASAYPRALRPRLHELRARALEMQEQWLQAARERARLLPLTREEESAALREQIRAALERIPAGERRALLASLPPGDPLRLIVGEPPAAQPGGGAIVLLLHETGALAGASRLVADGFLASHFEARSPLEIRLAPVGTAPAEVIAAIRRLAAEDTALVVGPLSREAVEALWAEPWLPVPVLALNDAGMPPPGHVSFGLPPEQDGSFLAVELLARGVDDVALLVADEETAERAGRAFVETFRLGGGRVRGQARLDPRATDHRAAIGAALDGALAKRRAELLQRALGLKVQVAERHRADLDALVLIARPALARLGATQIRLFTDGELPMAGTALLYEGTPEPGDRDLEGLFFCDAPWLLDLSTPPPSRAAVAGLSATGPAQRLFLFGMDAERIARAWIESGAPPAGVEGGSGLLSVGADGRVQRQLACAVFAGGRPRPAERWP
jgi:outer membrane PBP1 activator LpoA protein